MKKELLLLLTMTLCLTSHAKKTVRERYNFNANYGGIPKNVWLHVTDKLYQTLPLYSNLGTTGVYVYASDFDIEGHKATVHLMVEPTEASQITIRLHDMAEDEDADDDNVEITEAIGGWLDLIRTPNSEDVKHELRIVEADFLTHVE